MAAKKPERARNGQNGTKHARRNTENRQNARETEALAEFASDSDSGCRDIYIPTGHEIQQPEMADTQMEVEEEAYTLLEHISLEWPSQTVDSKDSSVFLATNPQETDTASADTHNGKKTNKNAPTLLSLDLSKIASQQLKDTTTPSIHSLNRIRLSKTHVFALSDTHLCLFSAAPLKFIKKIEIAASYGLAVSQTHVYVGCRNGSVAVLDHNLGGLKMIPLHTGSVESIALTSDGWLLTGSTDGTAKVSESSGRVLAVLEAGAEVNAVDVRGNVAVVGDDTGVLRLWRFRDTIARRSAEAPAEVVALPTESEAIAWHKTPISMVRWRDDDVFVSCSDEQVCVWDISLEELVDEETSDAAKAVASSVPKYLLFVHQGQQFYKDCCFFGNRVAVTSRDGLCVFSPLCFEESASAE